MQVDKRLRIDEHAYVTELEDAIAFARLRIEADVVAQAGTAATLHAQAQPALLGRDAFLGHRAAHFDQGLLSNLNAFGGRGLQNRSGLFDHCRHDNDTPGWAAASATV